METLAALLPVAAVRTSGVEDVVGDDLSGLLSGSSVDAFAVCLRRLASDSGLRAWSAQGFRRTSQRCNIQRTSARLLTRYRRLVGKR